MMELVVNIFFGYLAIGLLFAILFAIEGVKRVDPVATGSSIWFRLLILPGSILLWPVLLTKWLKALKT